ncbi:MAG: cellulase family glycosylhydrolase [Candidatus Hydrogenedentes bacterium]|nr:cellulase family glycosylhydrolase [Candidatus Hydrogenedentota bacterium]
MTKANLKQPPGLTIGKKGTVLKDGLPYRAIGINYFSAFSRRLQNPDDTSYRQGFADLAKRGISFVRFMACGYWPVDWKLYQSNKEAYFKLLDDVVRAAEETGIGLIPSLFWYPAGISDLVREPRNQWGNPSSKTLAFMRQYTQEMVERYKDSSAIWVWEFGNEFSLDADLYSPEHRPPIVPDLGTATSRSDADDLTHEMVVTAYREFAKEVRKYDPSRLVTTGASLPRPSAEHLRRERKWIADSEKEFSRNLVDITPDPMNMTSVHIYPMDRQGRFDPKDTPYDQIVRLCMETTERNGKALFVGEFGAADKPEDGGPERARREFLAQLTALERGEVPLAALWVYDLEQQEDFINITPTNHRKYMLEALMHANRRIQLFASGVHKADIRGDSFEGRLMDNAANAERSGSAFNPLCHRMYPGQSLFRDDGVGLNFEHIFNGTAADKPLSMFTPRKDPCLVIPHSPHSASVRHLAKDSSWGMASDMKYTFSGGNAIDLEFTVMPLVNKFPLGYVAMMWASYMNHTHERRIHFYGKNGDQEGWITFGDDLPEGSNPAFETGTIAHASVPNLPYEEGAELLNLVEHPTKRFLLPFYYGLVDGDGDFTTTGDTMVYIMMFDQSESIRFALWNFIRDANTQQPNPHSPAWDWQYVIRGPKVGETYSYRARVIYKPFESEDDVRQEYEKWIAGLTRGTD